MTRTLALLTLLATAALAQWVPPVGIPVPDWGETLGNPIDLARPTPPVDWSSEVAGYYYVETGGTNTGRTYGTPSAPRASIPNSLPAGAVVFLNGTYSFDHRNSAITASGTSTQPVWILSYDPDNPPTATKQWTFLNGTYLIVDGINFDWAGQTYGKLDINKCRYHCFRNGTASGVGSVDGTDGTGAQNQGIWGLTSGTSFGELEQIVIYNYDTTKAGNWQFTSGDPDAHIVGHASLGQDIWVLDSEFSYTSGCAVQFGAGTTGSTPDANISRRLYVGRCTAHHTGQTAFWSKRADLVVFSENVAHTIRRDSPSNPHSGGFGGQYGPRNLWVINNTVYNCQSGVQIGSNSLGAGATATDIYVVGNTFYNIHDEQATAQNWRTNAYLNAGTVGLFLGGAGIWWVSNTVDDYDAGVLSPANIPTHISRNIFSNRATDVDGLDVHTDYNPSTANELDHNIFESPYIIEDASTWTSVASLTIGTGNVEAAPSYVNEGTRDYRLNTGSEGIDDAPSTAHSVFTDFATSYSLSIATDANGVSRPDNTNWDIGALEYDSGNPPVGGGNGNMNATTLSVGTLTIGE